MIRRLLSRVHVEAVNWPDIGRQAAATAVIVLVAGVWVSSRFAHQQSRIDSQQATTRATLVNGCERTRDRNAFLRVKLNPTSDQAQKYLPLLDCDATTDNGGKPVPALPDVVEELLAQARRGK